MDGRSVQFSFYSVIEHSVLGQKTPWHVQVATYMFKRKKAATICPASNAPHISVIVVETAWNLQTHTSIFRHQGFLAIISSLTMLTAARVTWELEVGNGYSQDFRGILIVYYAHSLDIIFFCLQH